jgi:predicted Ser/Thr protein kinase
MKKKVFFDIKKSEIEKGSIIGRGASTYVYQGVYRGRQVAIKEFPDDLHNQAEALKEYRSEIATLTYVIPIINKNKIKASCNILI